MARRNWFIKPEEVRVPLSDEQWIDVKKDLTAGDTRKIFTDLVTKMEAGQAAQLDPTQVGVSKLLTWILRWSLQDDHGPVAFTADALLALDPERYQEIVTAVETHETARENARAVRKNDQSGDGEKSTISPSAA